MGENKKSFSCSRNCTNGCMDFVWLVHSVFDRGDSFYFQEISSVDRCRAFLFGNGYSAFLSRPKVKPLFLPSGLDGLAHTFNKCNAGYYKRGSWSHLPDYE